MNYQEAIRIAEERERHLKKAFEEHDDDNSGTIDSDEILVLMEAIGLLKNLKSNRIEFITEMFMKYDENNDGVLSFEEFKGVHNAAVDDAAGRRRAKPQAAKLVKSRTASKLDNTMEDERRKMAEEKARKKAEEAERIRKENAEMKARIKAANKGRDSKELDAEIKKKQKELKEQRQAAKDAEAKRIKDENRAQRERIKNTQARATLKRNAGPRLRAARHPSPASSSPALAAPRRRRPTTICSTTSWTASRSPSAAKSRRPRARRHATRRRRGTNRAPRTWMR